MTVKGLFITFEGPEGAGKTTQLQRLQCWLRDLGINAVPTREPGGTEVAEKLRDIVKYHKGDEPLTDETELLLFAASRSQHVAHLIRPAIEDGFTVLCDRFTDSTLAYQGTARGMNPSFITELNTFVTHGFKPDVTLLFDLSPEAGMERAIRREEPLFRDDRIENETKNFHEKVRQGYLNIAAREPDRVKLINADQSPDEVHEAVCAVMRPILKRHFGETFEVK